MKPKSKSTGFKAGLRKVGDFYYYKVKVGGRTHHGSTGCTSRDEAMEWLVSFKKAKKRQTGGFAGIPTVSEVAAEYLEARLDKSDGWKTRLEASMRLWIGPMLGSIRVDRLQLRDITRFKNHYMETPKSNGNPHNIGGLRTLMIDLRAILNYAINARYIHELPFGKLVMPKEQKKPVKAMFMVDVPKFFQVIDERASNVQQKLVIRLMLLMGLRISEATSMRWAWFRNDYSVYIPGWTKGLEADPLPVFPALVNQLKEWRKQTEDYWLLRGMPVPSLVFWNEKTGKRRPSSFVTPLIRTAAKHLEVKESWGPHVLRSSCATLLAESGASPMYIQQILRHKDIKTTMRYIRITELRLQEAQTKMVNAIQGKSEGALGFLDLPALTCSSEPDLAPDSR